jgi:PhzF family phenazine biosynthesis protein
MQAVASEMNLAETAFLLPEGDGWNLRWFTPLLEVDLCGHATLASAHVLWEAGVLEAEREAPFYTKSGLLTATREGDAVTLNFPETPETSCEPPEGLLEALGGKARYVGRTHFDYLVVLESEAMVRALQPDMVRLSGVEARGVMVTAQGDASGYDFVSRFFAPRAGIPEDPVTGSTHCCLAPFWAQRLGKSEFCAYQASPRGGEMGIRLDSGRVFMTGKAVTVLRGELLCVSRDSFFD